MWATVALEEKTFDNGSAVGSGGDDGGNLDMMPSFEMDVLWIMWGLL